MKSKILAIVGARPQFIKAAAIHRAFKRSSMKKTLEFIWLHTGQHYDHALSGIFFEELKLPTPKYYLGAGSLSHAQQTGRMMEGIEGVIRKERPEMVLVFGDTNSTLAGALAAAKLQTPIAHVEAGLRSFNRHLPEEINRVVTDRLAEIFFCPTLSAAKQLKKEGVRTGIHNVGDVMADLLKEWRPGISLKEAYPTSYYLATIHRNTNTEESKRLLDIVLALDGLDSPVVMPLHPRTVGRIRQSPALRRAMACCKNIVQMEPVSYKEMLTLESRARGIITDSGGVQKEAYLLGIPCVTLREQTEWPETVEAGMNVLCSPNAQEIKRHFTRMQGRSKRACPAIFGDGNASIKIINILAKHLGKKGCA